MAILAECDICGSQHRVKDGLVGHSIRCKDCGVQFVVLDGNRITSDAFVEEGGRLRRREPLPAAGLWPRMIAGLVTVLVFVTLTAIVWTFFSLIRPGEKDQKVTTGGSSCKHCRQPEIVDSPTVQEQ
jgi:hypothetical protein